MNIELEISREVEERLRNRAIQEGIDPVLYAKQLLEKAVMSPNLQEMIEGIRSDFDETGMTDNELSDFLEAEKHAARKERQSRN